MSRGVPAVEEEDGEPEGPEQSVSAPAMQEGPERELSHEEFDPKGTLALILMYFTILVVMWVFMYFIEFLGNDLVVVG
ncbi:hypothetical protein [Haloarchaeobius salinus]|uniref:hypothetical protein n=1 Tax=Haloarchaeobius salinus TaxID=1198298 RepID=UPI00210CC209|nr:hypothetical protein [Haloarchaeobius salinus]